MKKESVKFNTGFTPTPTFRKQHSCASTTHSKSRCRGFTLIELLVVVAIIGILSTIVIASLNGAREKGKIATIKSTLKQLYNQAALNQLENGSFVGSNDGGLNCIGTNNNLAKIVQPLVDQGIVVKCFSFYGTDRSPSPDIYDGDDFQRFGATALIYDTNELKAWSVDENGVVKWDLADLTSANLPGGNTKTWFEARDACLNYGGRLPSMEQSRTLSVAWYSKTSTYNPSGFNNPYYWSSTPVPSSSLTLSYYRGMYDSGVYSSNQNYNGFYAHCVR